MVIKIANGFFIDTDRICSLRHNCNNEPSYDWIDTYPIMYEDKGIFLKTCKRCKAKVDPKIITIYKLWCWKNE